MEITLLNPDPAQTAFVGDLGQVRLSQTSSGLSFRFCFIQILVTWSKRVAGFFCFVWFGLFVCFPYKMCASQLRSYIRLTFSDTINTPTVTLNKKKIHTKWAK